MANPTLRFGPFELEPEERRLSRRGKPVPLSGKPLELLIMLAREAPRLVRRDELCGHLWPGRVLEFDQAVNACVRDVRRALGDDHRQPRYIETVPRHGYRFVARVTRERSAGGGRWIAAAAVLLTSIAVLFGARQPSGTGESTGPLPAADAREAFVRGAHLLSSHDPARAMEAVGHFRRALDLDPGYADAWVGLAEAKLRSPLPPRESMPVVEAAVSRALALNPRSGHAHRLLADVRFLWHWDARAAESSYRRALDLPGDKADTYHAYASFLMATGRPVRAFRMMDRALAIDPLSLVLHGDLAWFYAMAGRHQDALEECDMLLELDPDNPRAVLCPLRSLLALGRLEAAAEVVGRLMGAKSPAQPAARIREYWEWRLGRLQSALADGRFVEPVGMAITYARLGEPVRALDWIEAARKQRSRLVPFLKLYPEFQALHGNPRFARVVLDWGESIDS